MDRVLFGDNQFFGVNHMSEEKARSQAMRFQKNEAIIEVLDAAYAEGVRTFMCTTHERIADVCDHFRANKSKYPGYTFYPCMPYAHKYANAAAELGVLGAVRSMLPQDNAVSAAIKGGMSLARKDIESLAGLLIDAEMKMFHGLDTPVVFMQNVVTDFLLGLGMDDAFRMFADHVKNKYAAEAGFITMNLPLLLQRLNKVGIENPIICANINKIGFRMCGGLPAYEQTIAQGKARVIAMSVLASGALEPEDALAYVAKQPGIQSIVFGASSRKNIAQTKQVYDRLVAARAA